MEEKKEKPVKSETITLEQVPTQHAFMYKLPDGSLVGSDELLLWMANRIYEVSKKL